MEGGLSVIMVMEDCQCSYTGLFDQVPGVIRNGRVISKPKPPPYFHLSQSCMAQGCNFFFSSATRTDMKSKGSCMALVCVSVKFIDFIFLVSLLTHFKRQTKNNIEKQTTTKRKQKKKQTNKQTKKQNKQKKTNKKQTK